MAEAAVSYAGRSDRFPYGNNAGKHRKEPFGGFRRRERIVAYGKRERFCTEFRVTVEVRSETAFVLFRSHKRWLKPPRPIEGDLTR